MYVVSIVATELRKCTSVIAAGALKREQHLLKVYITEKRNRKIKLDIRKRELLYSWRFSRYSAPIHWLVHCHMTSNNETVSRQMP